MKKQLTATEKERENLIFLWIKSWKEKNNLGIEKVFAPNVHYIRSWGPEYHGLMELEYWFDEKNDRGTVENWDIERFIHEENNTIIHWFLEDKHKIGKLREVEGLSIIEWNDNNKIKYVQDFICNTHRSDPYKSSESPIYTEQQLNWFDKLHR